jgi:2-keto-4-pentenoate hydratase
MRLTPDQVAGLASALYKAEQTGSPIEPLSFTHPEIDADDAYAIQLEGVRLRMQTGAALAGWKIGLTSKAMQQMLGIREPDFGHLFDTMRLASGSEVACAGLIWPRVEPEIAFRLKADLRGPGISAADVVDATEYLMPALELIDSRIKDWRIKLVDTVADNASCGRYVLGDPVAIQGFDVRLIGMNYYLDRDLVSTATGAAVLGNPAEAVAWLANMLSVYGQGLQAGQIVMPGSLVAAVDARPGRVIRAEYDRLGPVELRFK